MAKQLMLAVAGSGKTYTICNTIDSQKKNLILAYTHENIRNINRELILKFGKIPELTSVMTFDSFVYRFIICPFEPTILKFFNEENLRMKGITMKSSPKKGEIVDGIWTTNFQYKTKEKFAHYHKNYFYYCDTLTELIAYVKNKEVNLLKKAAKSINYLFETIRIDEFQDYREYDYDVIIQLAKNIDNITLVGDFYQHSVAAKNNTGKPFKKQKKDISYIEFKQQLEKEKFSIDETTLCKSRRCPHAICRFIEDKLNIKIESKSEIDGKVIFLNKDKIAEILNDKDIVKLVYKDSNTYTFNCINWSYSKGNTYENTCVILTKEADHLDSDSFNVNALSIETRNKLYVACTRTKGNLYFIKNSDFKKIKKSYQKTTFAEGNIL